MKAQMKTVAIYIALGVIVIVIIGIAMRQQAEKTDKTVFQTLWEKFFPKKMESVVIPGTTVGASCPTLVADNIDTIAQAVVDCWSQGETYRRDIRCCYIVDSKPMKKAFDKKALQTALKKKPNGAKYAQQIVWQELLTFNSAEGYPYIYPFTICLDYDSWSRNEVYLTMRPDKDC